MSDSKVAGWGSYQPGMALLDNAAAAVEQAYPQNHPAAGPGFSLE